MKIDIDRLGELLAAATPGEWSGGISGNCNMIAFDGDDIVGVATDVSERNRALICALVNAAPELLAIAKAAYAYRDGCWHSDLFFAVDAARKGT